MAPDLPVREVMDEILQHLNRQSNLVLIAPPGAGKTTLVPLKLFDADWRGDGRIIVLEPRRLAARSAAGYVAGLLGEQIGETVGYRVRYDSKVSKSTRIEFVTQGVFIQMLANEPELESVAAVIFDEFHERSLDNDLALALCLDLQSALRPELKLIAMSATLEGAAISSLLQAPLVTSKGRSFPVEIIHRHRTPNTELVQDIAGLIVEEAVGGGDGDMLVFLPGKREIEQLAKRLEGRLPSHFTVHQLYGAVSPRQQDQAIRPANAGIQKIVLASAIAETSLTIDGVKLVIDSGMARQPVYEPTTGLTRLTTIRASRASVDQRAGRAGRTAPGRAIRLWGEAQSTSLPAHTVPEIVNADLSALMLRLADWGVKDPLTLAWLDAPPTDHLRQATKTLETFNAVGTSGAITSYGRKLAAMAFHPRLSHMIRQSAGQGSASARRACVLAFLLQDNALAGRSVDLETRLDNLISHPKSSNDKKVHSQATKLAASLVGELDAEKADREFSTGVMLAMAFPDRIARRGSTIDQWTRYKLANGRGAQIPSDDALAGEEFLVVADMMGDAGRARILSAAALSKKDLMEHFADEISEQSHSWYDTKTRSVRAQSARYLGELALTKPKDIPLDDDLALRGLCEAVRHQGLDILPWQEDDENLRQRLVWLQRMFPDQWPNVSKTILRDKVEDWLAPFLSGIRTLDHLPKGTLKQALLYFAGHPPNSELDRLVPSHIEVASGSRIPLHYRDETVRLCVRPQELFGTHVHPTIGDGQIAVELELLSPAGRPIQTTRDLPGFWQGSWKDVRSEMRGRYPKHPWPEDPASAQPTNRAKPRKN